MAMTTLWRNVTVNVVANSNWSYLIISAVKVHWQPTAARRSDRFNKNLCGRDGRTICGPLRVPKSTYVTMAHKWKPKFFYFACSLVRRCNCKQSTSANGTDGQTDRQIATQYAAPSEGGGPHNKMHGALRALHVFLYENCQQMLEKK